MSPSGDLTWELTVRVRVCRSDPSSVLQTSLHFETRHITTRRDPLRSFPGLDKLSNISTVYPVAGVSCVCCESADKPGWN